MIEAAVATCRLRSNSSRDRSLALSVAFSESSLLSVVQVRSASIDCKAVPPIKHNREILLFDVCNDI